MNYKLFVDDERFPTTPDWFVARTSWEALKAIEYYGMPNEMALDHDLGQHDTIMVFLNELRTWILDYGYVFPRRFTWSAHTGNPVGRKNIIATMNELVELSNEMKRKGKC